MTMPPILAQARSHWHLVVIGLLLIAVIVLSMMTCDYRKKGVSTANQATIDSLHTTQPTFDSSKLVARQSEARNIAVAAGHQATVVRATAGANFARVTADELARAALTAVNDAQKWHAAYDARSREADSLRVALTAANARADAERLARIDADRRASLDSARNVALQKLALGLEKDANKAANCRVAYVVPCATRVQTFVVGAIVGAAAVYVVAKP